MHLNDMALRAWLTAEEKGLHANLDGATELGTREQALLALIPLVLAVNDVIQTIKKQGLTLDVWDTSLVDLEQRLMQRTKETFDALLTLTQADPLPVSPTDQCAATIIRTLLIGTEVTEALETLQDDTLSWEQRLLFYQRELSDIYIRTADVSHGLWLDMDAQVEATLDANTHRPRHFGTPLEQEKHP